MTDVWGPNSKNVSDDAVQRVLELMQPLSEAASKVSAFSTRMDAVETIAADVNMRTATVEALTAPLASDIDRINTRVYDIRSYISDTAGATDMRSQFLSMLSALPAGAALEIPAGVKISLSGYIGITKSIHIFGLGWLDWTGNGDGSSARAGLIVFADHVTIEGVRLTNMSGETNPYNLTYGPRRAISIEANYATIRGCWVDTWATGIRQSVVTSVKDDSFGCLIENNFVTNIFGMDFVNGASVGDAEGDGIMLSGYGSIARGNIVRAKIGRACRVGVGFDGVNNVANQALSNATVVNDTGILIVDNIVEGPFTRSLHVEAGHSLTVHNNVAIGFLWWGIVTWNATEVQITNNQIIYTSRSDTPQPAILHYAAYRCGILGLVANTARIAGNTLNLRASSNWSAGIVLMSYGAAGTTAYDVDSNFIDVTAKNASAIVVDAATGDETRITRNKVRGGCERGVQVKNSPNARVFVDWNDLTNSVACIVAEGPFLGLFATGNTCFGTVISVTEGISAGNGTLVVAAQNRFFNLRRGVNATGTTESFAPDNTYVNVTNKTVNVLSTTAYSA